jgi:hypothetical protein
LKQNLIFEARFFVAPFKSLYMTDANCQVFVQVDKEHQVRLKPVFETRLFEQASLSIIFTASNDMYMNDEVDVISQY